MTPTDWQSDAACIGKTDLFYAPERVGQGRTPSFDFGPAVAICRTQCPVVSECRAWAIEAGEIDRYGRAVEGVVAGLVPQAKSGGALVQPTMRRCESEKCSRPFMSNAQRRYCSPECAQAVRVARKTESRRVS